MRRGQSLVVWAIREGRQAARAVDEFLMGEQRSCRAEPMRRSPPGRRRRLPTRAKRSEPRHPDRDRPRRVRLRREPHDHLDDVSHGVPARQGHGHPRRLRLRQDHAAAPDRRRPSRRRSGASSSTASRSTRSDQEQLFALRRRLGMLFQFGALFTDLTVFENVAFPLREHTELSDIDDPRHRADEAERRRPARRGARCASARSRAAWRAASRWRVRWRSIPN